MTDIVISVLLIEDNLEDADLIRELLIEARNVSFKVDWADRLAIGLTRLSEDRIDIILLDLSLPDSYGLETLAKLQAYMPDIPIVVLIELGHESLAFKALQAGAQDFLVKREINNVLMIRTIYNAIERVRAQNALRESEERFRQVVSSISDHVYMSEITVGGEHRNLYISPNVEDLTGYPVEKVRGDPTFWQTVLIHPDGRAAAIGQFERFRLGQNSEIEYQLIRADSQVIWVRDSGKIQIKDGTIIIYGVVSDISERKRAEKALLQERALLAQRVKERTAELSAANAELARATRLKDEFLADMSHELRTPLGAILGMSEILRENIYGPLNEDQLNALYHIEEGGRHLLDLINDILDLAKIEADKLELNSDSVQVESICQTSLQFIRQLAQKKQIKLIFSQDQRVATIQADERRLKQILVNLLSNAVKFTPEGGEVRLSVKGDETQSLVHFVVEDTGIGISKEDMDRLFKPFVQLDSKFTRQQEGTGLGLSLVSRLTEMHGGRVTGESVVDEGSTFMVSLPWLEMAEVPQILPKESDGPGLSALPEIMAPDELTEQPLILLAEDSEANISVLTAYLQAQGYQTSVARDGIEAIQRARETHPAMILMDIRLPVMDGLEAIQHLQADRELATVPIIALTALAMPGDRERCLAAGADDYLSKPVNLKELAQLIKQRLFETTGRNEREE